MAYTEYQSGLTLSNAQAITTSVDSTNIYDVTGAGAGNTPVMTGAQGLSNALGSDIGVGQSNAQPGVWFVVTTAGTGGAGNTLSCAIQAAPDSGTYTEGTYTVLSASQAFVGTALTKGTNFWLPVPPVPSNYSGLPRFYKVRYTTVSSMTVSMSAYLMMNPPNVKSVLEYGNNLPDVY